MNFKRKNKTNRSLQKKTCIKRPYWLPKMIRKLYKDTHNENLSKEVV